MVDARLQGDPVKTDIVVVVDDDRRVRESIQSVVESAGHATFASSTAEQFLRSGTLAEAGCLIADVRMPGIDGIELQRRVRVARPGLPIVFISAHEDDQVREQALAGGAVKSLYKPFDAADLLGVIERVLTKSPDLGDPSTTAALGMVATHCAMWTQRRL
jgi:FixJ family two-component response regulator